VIITDFKGNVLYYNQSLLDMMGVPQEGVEEFNVFHFIAPEHKLKVIRNYIRVFVQGGRFPSEYKVRSFNGKEMWVETLGRKIFYRGQPASFNVIRNITERKHSYERLRKNYTKLEHELRKRACELECSNKALKDSIAKLSRIINEVVSSLSYAVEKRDPYTAGHQQKVAALACAIAREMGLAKDKQVAINIAAIVHDIGKIYLPAEILGKPTQLSPIEFSMIKTHSEVGYDILRPIEFPWAVASIVRQHHERLDGTGYPLGLRGKDILMESRILAVADVVEAMASHRPYRPSLGIYRALDEISENRDRLYDQTVVDVCCRLFRNQKFSFK
jgi:PAS domain S-box-containing protein/putative nucleotidyltransferase with HDIG domain